MANSNHISARIADHDFVVDKSKALVTVCSVRGRCVRRLAEVVFKMASLACQRHALDRMSQPQFACKPVDIGERSRLRFSW
jgi:hypothetical protein